ncbi:hypothetical protein FNF29_01896 [Cafeteria roenbergensis]|uniref:SAM domain-containing protein n=2 Tax=Cafeteria roenbergensis TaxID=33653 RepID=A0A5A8CPX3_CAFRO|nr:hypothetical protein FNF29_01896 [Cafeteria roenbergensis]KAA0161818.1 hypothetical protein FNF31_03603 [Cafeteria roenbergensis]|eukprot:KAA0155145.1 hypothetical protein FNF29_01896 [Cafeteria roenbergensis]
MKAAISRLDCGERKRFGGLAWAALAGLALGAVCEWLTWEHSAAVAARTDISQIDLDDWSPGHVGMWLGQVGLGEKSPAFEAARIDGDTLFELDVDELADLGIGTPEELNAFHTARQKLAGLKVNARNPTANGFWEYRSVNRQFIAHALPGIALCPRTWFATMYAFQSESVKFVVNPDTAPDSADDPENVPALTAILDAEEAGVDARIANTTNSLSAAEDGSAWGTSLRPVQALGLLFFPHAMAAFWLLGFADTDPTFVLPLIAALLVAQVKEGFDLYHLLSSSDVVTTWDRYQALFWWAAGVATSTFAAVTFHMIPGKVVDFSFYVFVSLFGVLACQALVEIVQALVQREALLMRALKEEMRALTEEAALKGQELCAAPSTAPAPSEASSLGSERPAKFPRPVIRPRDPSPSPAAPASSEGDVQEGWFPSPTSKEAASEPRPASAQGAVQRDSTAQVGFGDLVPGPSEAAKVGFGDLVPGPSEAAQVGFGDLVPGPSEAAKVGFGDLVPGPSEAAPAGQVGFGDLVPGPSEAAPAAQVGFGDLVPGPSEAAPAGQVGFGDLVPGPSEAAKVGFGDLVPGPSEAAPAAQVGFGDLVPGPSEAVPAGQVGFGDLVPGPSEAAPAAQVGFGDLVPGPSEAAPAGQVGFGDLVPGPSEAAPAGQVGFGDLVPGPSEAVPAGQVGFGDLVPGPSEAAQVGFGDLVPGPSEAAPAAQVGFGDLTDQAGFFPEPPPEQRPVEPAEVPPGLFGDVQSPYTSDAPAAAARSQAASPGRPARPRLCERASSEGEELAHSMRLRSSTRVARAGADNALGHSRTTGDIVDGVEGLPATPSGN